MQSYSEYFRKRLEDRDSHLEQLNSRPQIKCKKRKYEEAMGYPNDYIVVQENKLIETNTYPDTISEQK